MGGESRIFPRLCEGSSVIWQWTGPGNAAAAWWGGPRSLTSSAMSATVMASVINWAPVAWDNLHLGWHVQRPPGTECFLRLYGILGRSLELSNRITAPELLRCAQKGTLVHHLRRVKGTIFSLPPQPVDTGSRHRCNGILARGHSSKSNFAWWKSKNMISWFSQCRLHHKVQEKRFVFPYMQDWMKGIS